MREIVWQTPASLDLVAIAKSSSICGSKFTNELLDRIEAQLPILQRFPMVGRIGLIADTREKPVPGTPYVIIYQIRQDEICILNIVHGARNFPSSSD